MASIIKIKRSTTPGSIPSGGALAAGELAVNLADRVIFSSSDGSNVIRIGEAQLANTNAYIAAVQSDVDSNEATERAALANTNIAISLINTNLTSTNTAIRLLVADRLQVANAVATYQTIAQSKAYLANTNAYIASIAATADIVNDTTPQLGGDLDLNGQTINGSGLIDITGNIKSSANVVGAAVIAGNIQIDVDANEINTSSGNLIIDSAGGTVNIDDNLQVQGNLTVYGTTTTVTSTTVSVDDSLLKLAANNASDAVDIGFYGEYNDGTTKYAGIFRDASATSDPFIFWQGLTSEPGTTVNFGSGSLATIEAVIDGGTY